MVVVVEDELVDSLLASVVFSTFGSDDGADTLAEPGTVPFLTAASAS